MGLDPEYPDELPPAPRDGDLGRLLVTPIVIMFALLICILAALYGCASEPATATEGLTNSKGDAVAVTYPIQSYTPEFSAKLAAQLKAAPPELAQFVVDALKLRCAIKPSLPYCANLLR